MNLCNPKYQDTDIVMRELLKCYIFAQTAHDEYGISDTVIAQNTAAVCNRETI